MTIAWSYSRLEDFESCPLMFQHKYILKTIKFKPNSAMERGKTVHGQLERETIRASYNAVPAVPAVAHVWPIIKAFVGMHGEVLVEEELAFKRNLTPCAWFDKDTWLRAKIDAVGRVNPLSIYADQVISILDWKTGKYRINEDQLRLYNMVAMLRWDKTASVSSSLLFVDQQQSSPPLTSTRQDLKDLLDEFGDRSEMIQIANERGDWPAQKSYKCSWCGVITCKHKGG